MLLKFEAEAKSLRPKPKIPEAKAEAEVTRPRPRPRPNFWPRGQFDLEALTSLSGSMNLRLQRRVLVQTVGHAQVIVSKAKQGHSGGFHRQVAQGLQLFDTNFYTLGPR